jgi:hypothetical protein
MAGVPSKIRSSHHINTVQEALPVEKICLAKNIRNEERIGRKVGGKCGNKYTDNEKQERNARN